MEGNRTPMGGQWEKNREKCQEKGKPPKKRETWGQFLILPAKTPYLFHNEWYFQFDVIKPFFKIGIGMLQDLPLQPAVVRTLGQRLKRCVTW